MDILKANDVIDINASVSSTFSDEEIEELLDEHLSSVSASEKSVIASVISTAFDAASDESDSITKKGKIQDKMREAIKDRTLDLERYNAAIERFEQIVKPADTKPPITDASRNVTVRLKKNYDLSPEFTALWDKISQKTTYRVKIDTETLVYQNVPHQARWIR